MAGRKNATASRSWGGELSGKRSIEWAQGINYRGDSGIGRAVAIAYAREGADVAINYLPDEEDDAREVVDLIKKQAEMSWLSPEIFEMKLLRPTG